MDKFLQSISALNDETRIKIIKYLLRYSHSCVCDLVVSFGMIQSRLSRHLKILKDAGYLKMQKDKKMSIYYVNDNLDSIQKELINHIKNLDIDIPIQQSIKGNNMEKKVLVLCTGNSCRSIMAEALINEYLDGVSAQSSGVRATGVVNKNAIQALNDIGIDTTGYHSKGIEEVIGNNYDLIVTVCDHASETCPTFPGGATVLHLGYEDPTGKEYVEYTKTRDLIKETLLPQVTKALS